ncbi:helix-turn-helix domain-containing protein [Microcoleus sp. D3_18a_C4]
MRDLRQQTGVIQKQFPARLGVVFSNLNNWENGLATPSSRAMQKIEP